MEDCVIVEAHIRDLLSHANVDLSNEERMEFGGLSKWLRSDDCYFRKLGANVVELQPVQEFDARSKAEYHWGYMPVNFFPRHQFIPVILQMVHAWMSFPNW